MSEKVDSAQKKKKLSSIVSVVRALIASKKPPYRLVDIVKEYPQVEGSALPYLQLGYNNAEELLRDTGEFVITRIDNEVCLASRNAGKCQHISEFVVNQKVSKSKHIVTPSIVNQRKPRESARNWNKSSYSSNLFQKFTSPQNKLFQANNKYKGGDRNNNNWRVGHRTSGHFKGHTKPIANKKINKDEKNSLFSKRLESDKMDEMYKTAKYPLKNHTVVNNSQFPDLREKLNLQRQQQLDKIHPRAILGQQKHVSASKMPVQNTESNKKTLNVVVTQPQIKLDAQQKDNLQMLREMQKLKDIRQVFSFEPNRQSSQQLTIKNEVNLQESKQTQKQQLQQLQHKQHQNVNSNVKQAVHLNHQNGYRNIAASSVQNRLKIYSQNNNNNVQISSDTQSSPNTSTVSTPSHHTPERNGQTSEITKRAAVSVLSEDRPVESLYEYCTLCNYPSPQYSVSKAKFEKNYQCRVQINSIIYFTYPDGYDTARLSKIGCALKAIEQIKAEEYRRPMRPCTITDYEFVERLHADLSSFPHGMFSNKISEFYESKYRETPPEHWWSLVTLNVNTFLIEKIQTETVIVFAKEGSTKDEVVTIQMEGIPLPWDIKHWDLFITHVVSPIEVWCRLFGDDFDKRFDKMTDDIIAFMKSHKQLATTVKVDRIYLVRDISNEWHRVRVMELNEDEKKATVFYIDYGDTDNLPYGLLFECEARFLHLPAQAVPFTLFGLEDFYGNPYALKSLQKFMICNKSIVGEVISNEESFNSDTSAGGKIQAAMFDTSTNNDINLNQLIMNDICNNTPPPNLKMDTVTNVIISHITTDGVIHFRIKGPETDYVDKLLYQLVESKGMTNIQKNVLIDEIESGKLILICDKSDNETIWYRGKLAGTGDINVPNDQKNNSEEFDIVYVDHGFVKRTHISNMYCLSTLSFALFNFPEQRLKARLRKIPDINTEVVGLIRSLMPNFCEAMFKMVGNDGDIPLVKAYRRIPPNPYLVPLNNIIRNEYEMGKFIVSEYKCNSLTEDGINNEQCSPTIQNFIDMKHGLTITTVPMSPKKSANNLPKISEYKNIPDIGGIIKVWASNCGSPSSFMVQPFDERKALKNLMNDLQEYYKDLDDFIPFNNVKVGEAYASQNEDGFYCRVIVKDIIASDIIHIFFCDFGDSLTVNNEKLKILPEKFRQFPKLALHAKLYNVEPRDGEYTHEDIVFFRKLAVGKKFAATVKYVEEDETAMPSKIIHLDLIDTSNAVDVLLRDTLYLNCKVVPSSTNKGNI